MTAMNDAILTVQDFQMHFLIEKRAVKAVNGVSFKVRRGKTLGLVGESGCGKSVTALSVMRLLPKAARIVGGSLTFHGPDRDVDLRGLAPFGPEIRAIRGRAIAMIFQDPMASLNPVHTVGRQIAENLRAHWKVGRREAEQRVVSLLGELGIPLPESRIHDYPHQFSGGMKQRAMIAMAMICNPDLLIADEPTTALDVTIQAQILELMKDVQRQHGTSILLITHNMGIIADMADDVAVMYMGKIVETGTREQVLGDPKHPYTRALLRSVPVLGIGQERRLESIRGSTPDPFDLPPGCEFSPRCDHAVPACGVEPAAVDLGDGHRVKCRLYGGEAV
jgi:peptide/nickel transport system ATP-binding protein